MSNVREVISYYNQISDTLDFKILKFRYKLRMAEKGSNGDAAAPSASANNSKKRTPDQYTRNFDLNEISPLRKPPTNGEMHPANEDGDAADDTKSQILINMATTAEDNTATDNSIPSKSKNKLKGTYDAMLTRLDISEKARLPFLLIIGVCVFLLVVVIVLIAFWPRIPFYMRAEICVEKECMDSSSQVGRKFLLKLK